MRLDLPRDFHAPLLDDIQAVPRRPFAEDFLPGRENPLHSHLAQGGHFLRPETTKQFRRLELDHDRTLGGNPVA